MPSLILILCIIGYSIFVIRKRVREIKAGKYCSCSDCGGNCSNCHGQTKK